ncbi:unnamed protein product [Camellia sinensis]
MAKVPHFHNGSGKVGVESCRAVAVSGDQRVGGTTIEELLVRMQEAFVGHQILEVSVVKDERGGGVECREVGVVA